ncbi:hypothetical protein ACFY7H_00900 [Streptomyces sp. NPDC012794]|uniref:hypothetical protein n=1 Tax=Streptomyces sp. NPDC012794 TaxID=3364850 RepID=UPI0036A13C1F
MVKAYAAGDQYVLVERSRLDDIAPTVPRPWRSAASAASVNQVTSADPGRRTSR